MTKKKILVLSHAGVLEVNRAVFQHLARLGADVVMVVPASWKGDLIRGLEFKHGSDDSALRVVSLPVALSGRGSLFFYRALLRRALAGWEPDVVFLDEEPWSLAALQTFLEFRQSQIRFFTKENLLKFIPWPFTLIERWVYEHAAGAFAVSSEVEDVLRRKGFSGQVQQLYHSYDPALFKPLTPEARARLRTEYGVPAAATVIAYFGRLTLEKGLLDLAAALSRLERQTDLPPWFFLCVGNGPARGALAEALSELPASRYRLEAALSHDKVGPLLATTDILALPSRTTPRWKEQFGRILVEAMASGAAVVGSDSGEIPHLIHRAGGGLVFREGDAEGLADCLTRLLRDSSALSEYQQRGCEYVRSTLTHDSVARGLLSML